MKWSSSSRASIVFPSGVRKRSRRQQAHLRSSRRYYLHQRRILTHLEKGENVKRRRKECEEVKLSAAWHVMLARAQALGAARASPGLISQQQTQLEVHQRDGRRRSRDQSSRERCTREQCHSWRLQSRPRSIEHGRALHNRPSDSCWRATNRRMKSNIT